jgi:hypothetical protein
VGNAAKGACDNVADRAGLVESRNDGGESSHDRVCQ